MIFGQRKVPTHLLLALFYIYTSELAVLSAIFNSITLNLEMVEVNNTHKKKSHI